MQRTTRTFLGFLGVLAFGGALAAACSASNEGSTGSTAGGTGGTGVGGAGGGGVTGVGGGLTTTGVGGNGTGGACASVSSEAESVVQPADIIIAVDTSGSMDEESAEVQANLNNFVAIITAANIDVHVVLIADSSVCIAAPLGSGMCNGADENLPGYQHVNQGVASSNALQLILDTYPQWMGSLRPNASKTIAVVSDDDSDLSAAAFMSQLVTLDASFQGFKFDAIVSSQDPDACMITCITTGVAGVCCPGCVALSAAEGTVYKQLVQQTSGVIGDLCEQDFDPVFNDMATAVVTNSGISCEYPIPPNPDGSAFDPTKVNVEYTSGGGNSQTIGNVPSAATCTSQVGGWYYDDPQNPTKITLCPSTCNAVQGDQSGRVDVLFGCDTIPAIPE